MITGCLRISKESIFSGLNNLYINNIFSEDSDERFGFTDEEVKQICIMISVLLLHSVLMYLYCFRKTFDWGAFGGYNNLLTVIVAVLILSIFYNIDIKNKVISKIITTVSKVSFEMYLISYIFDALYYANISLNFNGTLNYLVNYFVYVPLVFISSFICAYIINKISGFLFKKIKP